MRRALRLSTLLLLWVSLAPVAQAQELTPPPAADGPRAAMADTSRFLPRWLHPVYSLGIGWIQKPVETRQRYEAGFGGTVGLEARPASKAALRLSGEYQMLPANARGTIVYTTTGTTPDTIAFEYGATGWTLGARAELAVNPLGRLWLQGGAGLAHFSAGIQNERSLGNGYQIDIKAPGTNGAGWLYSGAVRYDIDPAPEAPLSVELRWQALDRRQDRLQMWRIALAYRGR